MNQAHPKLHLSIAPACCSLHWRQTIINFSQSASSFNTKPKKNHGSFSMLISAEGYVCHAPVPYVTLVCWLLWSRFIDLYLIHNSPIFNISFSINIWQHSLYHLMYRSFKALLMLEKCWQKASKAVDELHIPSLRTQNVSK